MTRGPTSSVTTSSASSLARRRLFFHPRYSITSTMTSVGEEQNEKRPAWYHAGLRLGTRSTHFFPRDRTPRRHDPRVPSAIAPRIKPAGAGTGVVGVGGKLNRFGTP